MEVFEASGTLFGWADLLNRRPVASLKINTPEPPSEATVPLSAAFTSKGRAIDENRVSGTAKNIGGKVEEGFGRVTGDTKTRLQESRNRSVELRKTCTARHAMLLPTRRRLRATLLLHLRKCCEILSRLGHTHPLLSRLVSDGC